MKKAVKTISAASAMKKAAEKAKLKGMSKEAKEKYKAGKRNPDSDSEYSYRSVVSAGGTRHVKRRRKREDGTYSDEESYHSSQDEDGEARRRRRRRDRQHGEDSDHSYYSVVSAGGTRHVRRRRRREDGTYSRSESFRSPAGSSDDGDDADLRGEVADEENLLDVKRRRGSGTDGETADESDSESESDVSVYSETSEGGTRYKLQRKRIRDADGNVVGYGEAKPAKSRSAKKTKGSVAGSKKGLESLQMKRNGELLREKTTDSLSQLRDEGEPLVENKQEWPGEPAEELEQQILEEENKIPSDFSDATTDDDIDLSKLNPAQRRQYLRERERKRKEREQRRRAKYGDKYDEIMKKRNAAKNPALAQALAEAEMDRLRVDDLPSARRRRSSNASIISKGGGRPKSMVTYDKGPPRDLGHDKTIDNRELGLAHEDWNKRKDSESQKRRRKSLDGGNKLTDGSGHELMPKLHRETTMLKPLPTIPQGRVLDEKDDGNNDGSKTSRSIKFVRDDDDDQSVTLEEQKKKEEEEKRQAEDTTCFDVDKDGKLVLKKKKIDLNNITAEELKALGIDPTLSAHAIAKKLKSMFGNDLVITDGGKLIGTRHIDDYDPNISDSELADDPDLDTTTLSGLKRVNIMMRRGGSALRRHMEKIITMSGLGPDKYAKDLDERDADIDFLSHYKLVEQSRIDSYARAFVVEDTDLDTTLTNNEARVALDGVPSVQQMTSKQMDYVMKVLHIDEASMITFRMFAVVTALCERVTHMDTLSQRLLEICNLADIERKLDLYKAMFYHNTRADRTSNFITADSLKIELIAGGLSWKQQQYILEKMEPNDWGEISFLDYMCYIPLFLSMHDNICANPLDTSNMKYTRPPRERPASVQRDMNPLGCTLSKASAYWVRKKAMEEMMSQSNNSKQLSKSYLNILNKYKADKLTRLRKLDDRRHSLMSKESSSLSSSNFSKDMIY